MTKVPQGLRGYRGNIYDTFLHDITRLSLMTFNGVFRQSHQWCIPLAVRREQHIYKTNWNHENYTGTLPPVEFRSI